MPRKTAHAADLPLRTVTPAAWVAAAMRDPLALLNDHAHLEKKAASNALELLHRYPGSTPPEGWVETMTSVARDEIEHLAVVSRLLTRRGGRFTRSHQNGYASALRRLVRTGAGPDELVDRLLVSALIEARSCERFECLAAHCDDAELARLYRGLCASEAGHYRVFLDMAHTVRDQDAVHTRWEQLLDAEADVIASQPPGSRMHSSPPKPGAETDHEA